MRWGIFARINYPRIRDFMRADKRLGVQQKPESPVNLVEIGKNYQLKNEQEVLNFLEEHQDIASFLNDATYSEIRKYFLNPLRLYVAHDPEDCQMQLLVLSIVCSPNEVDEAYDKFMAVEDDWYLAASSDVADRLCMKLDFE